MQKKIMWSILGTLLAVMVASISLVFVVGPKSSATSNRLVLSSLNDFEISNGTVTGLSSSAYSSATGGSASGSYIGSGNYTGATYSEIWVSFPEGITGIKGNYHCSVFDYNYGNYDRGSVSPRVTMITIPDSVTSITDFAFATTSITSIIIPSSVTDMGWGIFEGCSSLDTIYCEAKSQPESWDEYWLSGCNDAEVIWGCKSRYDVIFNANGGSEVAEQTISNGEKAQEPTAPTKTGYDFIGWYTDEALTNVYDFNTAVTEDLTLYAKWERHTYIVTFDTDGGSLVDSRIVEYEAYATRPTEDPTKVGHTFEGWYVDEALTAEFDFANTMITANTTIYAKWDAISYTVTFEVNGIIVDTKSVDYGNLVDAPEVQDAEGYPFIGWYDIATRKIFDVETTPITGDLNLRATWGVFIVNFETNGGSTIQSMAVNENSKLKEPESPTQEGYTFAGWYTDKSLTNEYDFDSFVTENMTLYAKWEADTAEEPDNTVKEENSAVVNADKNNMTGVIAGVSVGAAVLIVAGVTVGVVLAKKRRK